MRPIAGRLQRLVVIEQPQRLEHIFELGIASMMNSDLAISYTQ